MPGTPSRRTLASRVALCCCAVSLSVACATIEPAPSEAAVPPPQVRLGPTVSLLEAPTARDKVRAIAGSDGSIHVLVASTERREVVEVIVPLSAEVQRRVIRSQVSPSQIDVAFDARGRLHALIDAEHFVMEGGTWQRSDRTPWQSLASKPEVRRFVRGAPDLVWVFELSGTALDAPGRVEIHGFGGYAGAIFWPWLTHGRRTVLVADSPSGYGPWVVLEPQGKEDTAVIDAEADERGNVHLVYGRSRGGLMSETSHRYIKLGAELLRVGPGTSGTPDAPASSTQFRAVEGQPIDNRQEVPGRTSTGATLIPRPAGLALRLSLDGERTLHALTVGEARDQWWGKGFPIRYLAYSGGAWSGAIDAGLADVSSFWGYIWGALDIVSAGHGRAFLVWPTERAIVGRWVERLP